LNSKNFDDNKIYLIIIIKLLFILMSK
jgi:hypothetical protein